MTDSQSRPPLHWETDIIFKDDATKVAIKVNKAETESRSFFSIEVGKIKDNGSFVRFFVPQWTIANFQATVQEVDVSALAGLMKNAALHIELSMQKRLDEQLAYKQAREQREVDSGKPKVRPGLKKIGKVG